MSARNTLCAAVMAAAAATGMTSNALASDAQGQFSVRGAGGQTCAVALDAVAKQNKDAVRDQASWIMGWMTASNHLQPGTFDGLPTKDGKELVQFIHGLCRSQPALTLEAATAAVARALAPLRLTRTSPEVVVTSDGKSVILREETIRLAERKLKEGGYYKGNETGASSAALIAAVRKFQEAKKLPATGLPDLRTLLILVPGK